MEPQGIKVSREGGKSGTAEHPPTGGCEDQSPKWQVTKGLHQFCNLGSVKLQVAIQFSYFLKGCVSNDDLFLVERVGSEGSALDTHYLGRK